MNQLEDIIEKICTIHEQHNTLDFYREVILCCAKCMPYLDPSLLLPDEVQALHQAIHCWQHRDNQALLGELQTHIAKKYARDTTMTEARKHAHEALLGILMPYDKWEPQGYERPYTLEYFVFNLGLAGVPDSDVLPILNDFYADIAHR